MKHQTFNDGTAKFYKVDNIGQQGNLVKKGITLKESLRFEDRTVGMSRFYVAKQSNVKIDMIIRCPRIDSISTQDLVIPKVSEQFEIKQIQNIYDTDIPCMDLSLSRLEAKYDITRT